MPMDETSDIRFTGFIGKGFSPISWAIFETKGVEPVYNFKIFGYSKQMPSYFKMPLSQYQLVSFHPFDGHNDTPRQRYIHTDSTLLHNPWIYYHQR